MSNRIKPRTTRVVVYQGDDLHKLSQLDDAVTRAEAADMAALSPLDASVLKAERAVKTAERDATSGAVRLMHQDDPVQVAQAALAEAQTARDEFVGTASAKMAERDEFAAEAEARGVWVQLVARPRLRWRALMKEHGPRPGIDDDKVFGVNMETLPDVLLPESVDRDQSTIEGDTTEFLDSLSDVDYYDRLFVAAFALNRGSSSADPTQRLLFDSSQTSAATSS